jgi:hypothetical protein
MTVVQTVTKTFPPKPQLDVSYPLNPLKERIVGTIENRLGVFTNALRDSARRTVTEAMRGCADLPRNIARRANGGLRNIGKALHQLPNQLNDELKTFEKRVQHDVRPLQLAVEVAQKKVNGIVGMSKMFRKAVQHGIVASTEKAIRDLGRHTKRIGYETTLRMIEAGGITAQGARAAADATGKVTKQVASQVERVASNLGSACRAALSQLATKIKSRQYEPESYRYVEPEGFYREASSFRSDCVRAFDDVGQQCKVDGDAKAAYETFYRHADYLSQETQQVYLVDHQDLLSMVQLCLDNLSTLSAHQADQDTAAFTTVIFNMREQVLRWDPQQECRASFD